MQAPNRLVRHSRQHHFTDQVPSHFVQGPQNECPRLPPGVRHGHPVALNAGIAIKQQVQIQGARGVLHTANPPSGLLQSLQSMQQINRIQLGCKMGHGVHIQRATGLVRRGFIE